MPATSHAAENLLTPEADPRVRRAATRLILRFVKTRLLDAADMFGGDLAGTLVMVAVTDGNTAHVDDEAALFESWSGLDTPPPDEIRRPVTGYMAAQWLGMSRETVRRKLNALIALGMVERVEGGYIAPQRAVGSPEAIDFTARSVDAMRSLFRALAQLGLVPPAMVVQAGVGPLLPRMCARANTAFVPPVLDSLKTLTDHDLTSAVVLAAIANSSMATPPEPPSAVALVARLGLPRETARRHVAALEARGLVVRTRAGLTVPDAILDGPIQRAVMDRVRPYREAFLARLAQAGVLAEHGA